MKAPKKATFKSERAMEVMGDICDFLAARASATTAEIAAFTGLSGSQSSTYITHMRRAGLIHCAQRTVARQGGTSPALWAFGAGALLADNDDYSMRHVVISSTWQRGQFRRDPMDVALFGAAQQ